MLLRIVFTGLALSIVNIFLKKKMSEFVLPTEIIFLALSAALLIEYLQGIFTDLSDIIGQTEYGSEIFTSAVKGAGICLITKFSSDICIGSDNRLAADVIELTGRIMLTVIAVPYIESIMSTAFAFVK